MNNSIFGLLLEAYLWHLALGASVSLYGFGMTQIMYAKAMREVLEERKHQRELEIMGMNLEMERLRHGQITHSPGPDCGGPMHCSTDGEANTAIPEDTSEGAA